MPQVKDTFVDPVLTNLSVRTDNELAGYISEKVFPIAKISKKSGFYFTYDQANLRIPQTERGPGSRANRVDHDITKTAYGPLIEHSLEHFLDDDTIDQHDSPLEPRSDATKTLTTNLWLKKEDDLATTLADTAKLTKNATLSGTSQWSDSANSDPFSDIQTAIDSVKSNTGQMPNMFFMGYQTWAKLMHHPDLIERVKYSQLGVLTLDLLMGLFSAAAPITSVHVGSTVKNTAKEGQTDSLSFVWGKHFWVAFVAPTPTTRTNTLGYHLQLKNAREIDRWDDRAVKGEFVRITDYFEAKIINDQSAYLIKNAIA